MSKLLVIAFVLALFISGCSSKYSMPNRISLAKIIAAQSGLESKDIKADKFTLRTYSKITDPKAPLRVFIEGDGFAWVNSSTISPNPTPTDPLALRLASIDRSKNIAYIARPCQYVTTSVCKDSYWSDRRFSKEVIESFNEAINKLKSTDKQNVELVGFSGGGAVAVLVASMRQDVTHITTISGNLDHKRLNAYHKVSQMNGSLNAIDVAKKVAHIPQLHLVGADDKIVLPFIANAFKNASNSDNVIVKIVPNCTHIDGWEKVFLSLQM